MGLATAISRIPPSPPTSGNGNGYRKAAPGVISIPALNRKFLTVTLIGDSPLLSHAWSAKALAMIEAKQGQTAEKNVKKGPRDPFQEYADSLYWDSPRPEKATQKDVDTAQFGFPSCAFKTAAVDACRHCDGLPMVMAKGVFHVLPFDALVPIYGSVPYFRKDMVRLDSGVADIRYRGCFKSWYCRVLVRYNPIILSAEQITNLFNIAGDVSGIGDNRPSSPESKNGTFGMFHVATAPEMKGLKFPKE